MAVSIIGLIGKETEQRQKAKENQVIVFAAVIATLLSVKPMKAVERTLFLPIELDI